MTMTDPIADMLARLRNANSAYHEDVAMPQLDVLHLRIGDSGLRLVRRQ